LFCIAGRVPYSLNTDLKPVDVHEITYITLKLQQFYVDATQSPEHTQTQHDYDVFAA